MSTLQLASSQSLTATAERSVAYARADDSLHRLRVLRLDGARRLVVEHERLPVRLDGQRCQLADAAVLVEEAVDLVGAGRARSPTRRCSPGPRRRTVRRHPAGSSPLHAAPQQQRRQRGGRRTAWRRVWHGDLVSGRTSPDRRRTPGGSPTRRSGAGCRRDRGAVTSRPTATVIPHTGSVVVVLVGAASATARADGCGRRATMSARIDRATSSAVRAPMSSPAGVTIRAASAGSTSRPSTTAAPRLGLATSPTYPTPARECGDEWRGLVPAVRGDDHGRGPVGDVVAADGLVAERLADRDEGTGDRAVADDGDQRCGTLRLEEDLQACRR